MEELNGMSEIEKANRREDQLIVSRAFLGHDLHEVYSNKRLCLASSRNMVESYCKLASVDVSEMFSPERVTKVCEEFGLVPGQAMDLKNGFDFDRAADRNKAWKSIIADKPKLVIGSPPCTFFSKLQELNKYMYRDDKEWMAKFQLNVEQAKRYVRFCTKIYEYQRENGRYFLHEHPWLAASWCMPEMQKLESMNGVIKVTPSRHNTSRHPIRHNQIRSGGVTGPDGE